MDRPFLQQQSNTQQPGGLSASLHILKSILNWLVGFFELMEAEQEDAGIHLGDRRYR